MARRCRQCVPEGPDRIYAAVAADRHRRRAAAAARPGSGRSCAAHRHWPAPPRPATRRCDVLACQLVSWLARGACTPFYGRGVEQCAFHVCPKRGPAGIVVVSGSCRRDQRYASPRSPETSNEPRSLARLYPPTLQLRYVGLPNTARLSALQHATAVSAALRSLHG